MQLLQEIQGAIGALADEVGPKVAGVGRFGSGVVIGDGLVLTNAHVIRREHVRVRFADGRTESGTVAGIDPEGDVAVISADTGGIEPIEWADGDALGAGTPVFALANPGGRGLRVTLGFVSSVGRSFRGPRGRRIKGSVEHTAPLARGSSGSPIVDAEGRLLGLNTIRLEGGLILAIAADAGLRERATSLSRGEAPTRATLGLALAPPRVARRLRSAVGLPERDGLLVRGVVEESPAERAGIEKGDLIVSAGGTAIAGVDDLYELLDKTGPEGKIELELVRGTDERAVEVTLG
ncbi:MAG TPA: S1C family serine protease [Gaiellaceae bacterium]